MDQPGGPSNHCFTSSGLVKASKTRRGGALNTRVIAISRSLGVATLKVSEFIIRALSIVLWVHAFSPCSSVPRPSVLRAGRPAAGSCPPKYGDTVPATLPAPGAARDATHKYGAARQRGLPLALRHWGPADVWRLAAGGGAADGP